MKFENDAGVSDLVASEEAQKICTGFEFTEGPLWIPNDNCLLFSDIPADKIYRWRPGNDEAEVYRHPSGHADGLTLDLDGNLLICEHGGRRVITVPYGSDLDGDVIAETYDDKRLNSPNDVVVSTTGAVYFSDPDYGLLHSGYGPGEEGRELDKRAVYRIATNGAVQQMVTDLPMPNGLAFSPSESLIFISDSQERKINRYTVFADGALSSQGELIIDLSGISAAGTTDGLKVDTDGRIWTSGPGGIHVIDMDGTPLGSFSIEEQPTNLAWGGPDFSTLYIAAQSSVYSIETNVRGIAPGS